jgi:hypothetical protein
VASPVGDAGALFDIVNMNSVGTDGIGVGDGQKQGSRFMTEKIGFVPQIFSMLLKNKGF